MKKRILFLLAMVALAATANLSMAQRPQKRADKSHQVDFAINYNVESNYNTADLGRQLFDKNDTDIFIISHRGDWHGTAENSLHSIQKAIEKGCQAVMVDVKKTKDDSLIIFSDDTLGRMTNGTGAVKDRTLAQLKALYLKEYHGNKTPLRIPTLAEALSFCKGKILIGVTNYKAYQKEIDALVKTTGTETEYFELDKVKRKKAETWKLPLESQERRDGSQKATYAKLMKKGVTVFITDAPKAFNTMLGISHVIASQTVSRVYGDGQKIAYIVVRYDDAIDGTSVNKNTYKVNGYEVEDAYTSADDTPEGRAATGHSVIIELNTGSAPMLTKASPVTVVYRQVLPVKTEQGETYTERLLLRNTMSKTIEGEE